MNSSIPSLLFVSIFHLLGGLGVGAGLRQLLARQFNCSAFFIIIWGLGFGLGPLAFDIAAANAQHTPFPILIALLVFIIPLLAAAFIPQDYLSNFTAPPVTGTVFGLVFFFVGAAVAVFTWQQEIWVALLFGGIFMLSGAFVTISSVRDAFKDR